MKLEGCSQNGASASGRAVFHSSEAARRQRNLLHGAVTLQSLSHLLRHHR